MATRRPLTTAARSRLTPAEKQRLATLLPAAQPPPAYLRTPPNPLEIELGMGNGLALLERAKAAPNRHFIGCEVYPAGLAALLNHPIPANLHIFPNDARDLLAMLPPQSTHRVLILFPDPWPKSRHHKRRLVQPELLNGIKRILKPGGELWVVTDWPDYALHTLALLYPHKAFTLDILSESIAADAKPSARLTAQLGPHQLAQTPAWWVKTKYQLKAEKAGRAPWFICAIRL